MQLQTRCAMEEGGAAAGGVSDGDIDVEPGAKRLTRPFRGPRKALFRLSPAPPNKRATSRFNDPQRSYAANRSTLRYVGVAIRSAISVCCKPFYTTPPHRRCCVQGAARYSKKRHARGSDDDGNQGASSDGRAGNNKAAKHTDASLPRIHGIMLSNTSFH